MNTQDYRDETRSQDAIDDLAKILKILPALSQHAENEFSRAILRMSISAREELVDAIADMGAKS